MTIATPPMPWQTVRELLSARARLHPDRVAIIAESRCESEVEISYARLLETANRIGNAIAGLGVEPGSRIGLYFSNHCAAEQHLLYHGVHAAGCVNVPVNNRYTPPEVRQLLEIADCRLVFVEREFAETATELGADFDYRVLSVDGSLDPDLHGLIADASAVAPDRPVEPGAECDWVFTSGTTALPKAAAFTQRACVATGIGVAKSWELVPGDLYQSSATFYTSSGIHTNLLGALAAGCTYYIEPTASPNEWARRVAEHGTTAALVFTPMLKLVHDEAGGLPPGTQLRRIVYAGQTVPIEEHVAFIEHFGKERGCELVHLTGSTEGGPTGVYCPARFVPSYPGSIGDRGFAPWTSFRVLREDGSDAEEGETGELWYAAPSVMSRYVDQPEATAATLRDGGVLTGDLVRIGEDGFLWFVDRKKDIIRRGGLNVASAEVESVLALHPAVFEAAVVPVPHEVYGEEVKAVVVAREPVEVAELQAFCRERLASYKVPVVVEFVEELPRNALGKIVKAALRGESYAGGTRA
jgi:acyl-CoA synthetase (AMP-forming)/AMP-acid ligase II